MKRIIMLSVLIVMFSGFALADVRLPDTPKPTPKPKEIDSGLTIELDKSAQGVKLIIPKSELRQLRAQLNEIDDESDTTASLNTTFTRTQTIVSGVFMSLAIVFGGVWFMRSRKVSAKTIGIVSVPVLGGFAAIIAFANVPVGQYPNNINDGVFSEEFRRYDRGYTPIKVQVSESNREFKFIVPRLKDKVKNEE